MGQGLYFLLAYGILHPERARGPLTPDAFALQLDKLHGMVDAEAIKIRSAHEAEPPYLAIPVGDTAYLSGRLISVQLPGGPQRNSRYALPLGAFPQAVMTALGNERDQVELHWTRVQYLAGLLGLTLPDGTWLFISEYD